MDLHVIGGFLGSGKTTAIINALKITIAQGKRAGVITNDKGRHLVDTAFIGATRTDALNGVSANIRMAEVPGGCFRCNYHDFLERISQLQEEGPLDVLFAESVGSCVDLVGPVLLPMISAFGASSLYITYSVFVDIRLLHRHLTGMELPFNDNIAYIFSKQIEESHIIVINKSDLMPKQAQDIIEQARLRFPDKAFLLQNSLSEDGVMPWLHVLADEQTLPAPLALDYEPYIAGGADLAWYDEKIILSPQIGQEVQVIDRVMAEIRKRLHETASPIAHLKFLVQDASTSIKLSYTALDKEQILGQIPDEMRGPLTFMINARVQMDADQLKALIEGALYETLTMLNVTYRAMGGTSMAPVVPHKDVKSHTVSQLKEM